MSVFERVQNVNPCREAEWSYHAWHETLPKGDIHKILEECINNLPVGEGATTTFMIDMRWRDPLIEEKYLHEIWKNLQNITNFKVSDVTIIPYQTEFLDLSKLQITVTPQ